MKVCGYAVASALACYFVENVASVNPDGGWGVTHEMENVTEQTVNYQNAGERHFGLVSSAIIAVAPLIFLALFIKNGPSCRPRKDTPEEDLQEQNYDIVEVSRCGSIILTAMILCVCFIFTMLETMAINSNVLSVSYISSIYTATHNICRLLALLLSIKLPARYMILVDNVFVIVGFVLIFFKVYSHSLIAVAFGALGFGLGAWFPRLLMITSHYTRI